MANANGTSMVGGDVPVPPNPGIKVPALIGKKAGKSKGRKGTKSSKTFKNPAGTKSGIMRNL